MTESELSRPVKIKAIATEPYYVDATPVETAALAKRFGLPKVNALSAGLTLTLDGNEINAVGSMAADWQQICAVSGDEFAATYTERVELRFIPERTDRPQEEDIELTENEIDEIEYSGDSFDLGEAVAQSFGLIIDPFATGPHADRARKEKGIQIEGEQDGPMAEMLAALKKG